MGPDLQDCAPRGRTAAPGRTVFLLAGMVAACSRPLPDAGSPGARVYAAQCGMCHPAYSPGTMTLAMWELQVTRMDDYRRRRGVPPLAESDRRVILDYLRAHAG